MNYAFGFLPLLAFALSGCAAERHSSLRLATGATAQTVCNAAFVSGLDPDQALRAQLHPEPGMGLVDWAIRHRVDRADRSVNASLLGGFRAHSVFRAGRGCTLVFTDIVRPAAFAPVPTSIAPLRDIAGPEIVSPAEPRLAAAIDAAFADSGMGAPRSTQAVVVVHRGRIIAERYAPGLTVRTPLDSHSLAKSVVNALVGILVRDGKLTLDRPVVIPGFGKDRSSDVHTTVAKLMRMDAGFGFDEGIGASVSSHIWYEEADTAAASAASIVRSPPTDGWGYCNRCYSILSKILADAVPGGPEGLRDFAATELFDPLGMRDVVPEFDQAGTLMGANAIFASPRDFARFGTLYLNDGVVDGTRILPPGWVGMSVSPTPGTGYGAGFWLNTTQSSMPVWPIDWGLPHAPPDAFFARGHLGQYIVIVPSSDLVIVRMGQSHSRGMEIESVGRLTGEVIRIVNPDGPQP